MVGNGMRLLLMPACPAVTRYYPQTTLYDGLTLNLVCHRPRRGERILLITNRIDLQQVLEVYGQRWAVETTFAYLKSRGFNLEDIHLTQPQRFPTFAPAAGTVGVDAAMGPAGRTAATKRKPSSIKNMDEKPKA